MTLPAAQYTGYLEALKITVVNALREAVATNYVNADFTNVWIGIEYPMSQQQYPGIWVDYDDRDVLEIASIDHREYITDDDSIVHEVTRWTYSGTVTLTIVAMSSRERDRLFDQFVKVFAFSRIENAESAFRDNIENNPFIGININWDELRPGGSIAAPGTPWGTDDEVIYEKSISFDCIGEFVSDPTTNTLAILSAIQVMGVMEAPDGSAPNVKFPDDQSDPASPFIVFDETQWH